MEALRIVKKINDDVLPELNRYKGKDVEIIILPKSSTPEISQRNPHLINELKGSCPDLQNGMEYQNKIREEWNESIL